MSHKSRNQVRQRVRGSGKSETGVVLRERRATGRQNAGLHPGFPQRLEPRRVGDRRSGTPGPSRFGEDEREIG
jgi:hypothetical protein